MARLKGCLFLVVILLIVYMVGKFGGSQSDSLPTLAVLPGVTSVAVNRSGFVTFTPAPGTIYPTATITDTPPPTITSTPAPTETPTLQVSPASSELYDVISTANARSCPDSKCELIGKLQAGNIISVTGVVSGENYQRSALWIQAIYHDGQTVYVHSSLVTPHVERVQPITQATVGQQSSFVCPRNCTDARAMGLSPQQAATCPNLDRDGDGQACYDDN